jgi:hypothetical protein
MFYLHRVQIYSMFYLHRVQVYSMFDLEKVSLHIFTFWPILHTILRLEEGQILTVMWAVAITWHTSLSVICKLFLEIFLSETTVGLNHP